MEIEKSTYEIRLGDDVVFLWEAFTAQQAVLDYLRSIGCIEEEITRVGNDGASWRGAVYKAVPLPSEPK